MIPVETNNDNYVFFIHDPETQATIVVDPGVADSVLAEADKMGWRITHIFVTHHHWDHVNGIEKIKAATGCRVIGHKKDAARIPGLDDGVRANEDILVGRLLAHVIGVDGHTIGHVAYYFPALSAVFTGDTLFSLGCGRMFEGTADVFWESLKLLRRLPDDTAIYCAHEYTLGNGKFAQSLDPTNPYLQARMKHAIALRQANMPTLPISMALEKMTNPFLRADDPEFAKFLGLENVPPEQVFAAMRAKKDNF
jgi:hydroxyacylglutathione hydrolase